MEVGGKPGRRDLGGKSGCIEDGVNNFDETMEGWGGCGGGNEWCMVAVVSVGKYTPDKNKRARVGGSEGWMW